MVLWNDDMITRLRTLWMDGHTARYCAEQLGIKSRNAVLGKLHRIGLSGLKRKHRPTATVVRSRTNARLLTRLVEAYVRMAAAERMTVHECRVGLYAAHGIKRHPSTLRSIARRIGVTFRTPDALDAVGPQNKAAADAVRQIDIDSSLERAERHCPEPEPKGGQDPNGCRWIHGDPKDPDWKYCGHDVVDKYASIAKSKWCEHHYRRVYVPHQNKLSNFINWNARAA